MIFDHVEDAAINGFSVEGNPQAESVLRFIDSKDVFDHGGARADAVAAFLQLEGAGE